MNCKVSFRWYIVRVISAIRAKLREVAVLVTRLRLKAAVDSIGGYMSIMKSCGLKTNVMLVPTSSTH